MRGQTGLHIRANTDPNLVSPSNESWGEELDGLLLSFNILTKNQVRRAVDEQFESPYPSK